MIYFMQPVEGGPVKIGFSQDVDTRRKQLECHYGKPLALLATLDGGRETEQEIHGRFAHLRLGRTEQFRPAAELMDFVGRPLLVGANPDTAEATPVFGAVAIRGSLAWRDWVMKLADYRRLKATDLIDQALVEYAERHGFPEPAPKR